MILHLHVDDADQRRYDLDLAPATTARTLGSESAEVGIVAVPVPGSNARSSTMNEYDVLQSVEQARHQMKELRTRLENEDTAPRSPEVRSTLGDLLEMLERLQIHYGLLREILARTNDAVFAKDTAGRYLMINPNGAGMIGKTMDEILGQDDTALFDGESAERIMAMDRLVMSTGTPQTLEESLSIRGVPITLLTTKTAWYEPRGTLRGLIGSAQDVTERRRAERGAEVQQGRLRSLASKIVITEERLRQALAAELHNGLGQDIALTKMKLSALRGSSSAELRDPLTRIELLVDQADRSLRSITFQLSPPSLHDLGLVPALQWLAEDIGNRFGLAVQIADEGLPALADEKVRMILFRAVRELLVNIATHAGAREAHVRLGAEDHVLRITVQDDGGGFEAAGAELAGYGLFGIREQMRHVGGSIHIDSVPGRGTTVALTAPFVPESTATASGPLAR